jgi:hypothetical protein
MVNLELLAARGRRAYEMGRLMTAARVALVLVPVAALAMIEHRARSGCACCAAVLLALAVWLRWRDRRGWESVETGLFAGAVPLVAGLVLGNLGVACDVRIDAASCTALSVAVGAAGGAVIAWREAKGKAPHGSVLMAGAVAALAAGVGCLRLGAASVAAAVGGLAMGAVVARRRRATPG